MKKFYCKTVGQTLEELSSRFKGLTDGEVKERLRQGADEKYKKASIVSKFFEQFFDLMIIILLLASVVSISIGIFERSSSEIIDGCIILLIVLMNAIFGVAQEYKAEKALESLNKIVQPMTVVKRGGKILKINTGDLVVGDVVVLSAGDIVPADLRLIESTKLQIDESSLTGESIAVKKNCDMVCKEETPFAERINMAYKGTIVSYGRGEGVVVAVGNDTEFGKIASAIQDNQKQLTPLQKSIKDVGKVLTYLVLAVAIITFIIEIIIDPSNIMEAFLTSVAIAVAAIPESMPAVITIIMSFGVASLARQKAIVKRLHSVETLGCCDVICSDKTGTITQNKMTVTSIMLNGKVIERKFMPGKEVERLLSCSVLCNDSLGLTDAGDPTEKALIDFAKKLNFDFSKVSAFRRVDEIPFDSDRKLMSVMIDGNDRNTIYCKGALDQLLSRCDRILYDGKIVALGDRERQILNDGNDYMTSKAQRVLAFAYREVEKGSLLKEDGLVLIGLIGMIDPPRDEIKEAVKKCKRAGMKPVMITGDHSQTALAIAREVGLANSASQLITGQQLQKMSDKELAMQIENYSIFARVTPEDKVRIVSAFKNRGHVVAMTGDGVNDAPSIKKADIGIGMGKSGTDVAKAVSDIIVTDDNFATIIVAVEEGRKIYQNIQKTVKFLFSANMAELFSLLIVTLIYPHLVFMLPVQILFVNLITDSFPAIALGLENPESDLMNIPPRDKKKSLFSNGVGWSIVILGLCQTLLVVLSYAIGVEYFDAGVAMTMGFYTLNIVQMFYLASMRTNAYFIKSKPLKNKFFLLAVGFCFGLACLLAVTPLGEVLGLMDLTLSQWAIVLGLSASMLLISEIYKFIEKQILKRKVQK